MAGRLLLFLGTLNRPAPYCPDAHGKGIAVFEFDPDTGDGRLLSLTEGIDNPTYLSFDPRRSCLYATSEVYGPEEGTATAWALAVRSQSGVRHCGAVPHRPAGRHLGGQRVQAGSRYADVRHMQPRMRMFLSARR